MQSDYERTGKLQRKIDIYLRTHGGQLEYKCSTNWWSKCRDAAQNWADIHLAGVMHNAMGKRQVVARFSIEP